ncbi:MAG: CoA transferase [Dehalococcoidales bacterium]|nr:CoA transferase [Dehalococcoidales bacterium]
MGKRALDGVMVADFGWVIAAPICTKFLADLGATVIRIESTRRPDTIRTNSPYAEGKPGLNRSSYFTFFNANKYSMSIDLNQPRGAEVARSLVKRSDIVIENFIPGMMKRWGLTYEDLTKVKPDIIMASLGMQGQTGPYARHRGYGIQLAGLVGFTELTGWPDRPPVQPYGALTDVTASDFAAAAIISALIYRQKTGKGQYLDLSQTEASLQFLAPVSLDYTVNGREPSRLGNSCRYAAPHSTYRCQGEDRWCAIAVTNDKEWTAFCRVLGNPDWTKETRFATLLSRKRNEAELDRLVESWSSRFTPEDVMQRLQAAGVPAGVVQNSRDGYYDAHLEARKHFWKMKHPEMGMVTHLGQSFQMSKTPVGPRMPAPCLGEHTEFVCREILGMPDEEFVELLQQGVLV